MHDCLIIGGGVIGLAVAWELSRHGLSCAVLDQQAFGQESSWAGAGMLPPGNPQQAETSEERLRSHSHVLWPEWSAALRDASGIDNGFRRDSALEVRFAGQPGDLDDEVRRWLSTGVACQPLSESGARELEPELGPGMPARAQIRARAFRSPGAERPDPAPGPPRSRIRARSTHAPGPWVCSRARGGGM